MSKNKKNNIKPWMKFGAFDLFNYLFLGVITFITFFPFWNSVVLSFNEGKDAQGGGVYFWPRIFTIENYVKVFENMEIWQAFAVSAARTVVATVISLFVTSLFAYALSKRYLKLRKLYLGIMLVTMYFSGGLIPTYLVIKNLGLLNNFLVYVLPGAFSAFYAQIFISFFRGLPDALEESAKIDGANEWGIYFKIILPLSKASLAAVGLFTAVGQWNAWYDNMLYVKKPGLQTLSFMFVKMIQMQENLEKMAQETGINELSRLSNVSTTSLQLATMMIAIIPIMCVYPFIQKHFSEGVMIGSIKG